MEKIYMEKFNNKKSKKVIKGRRIFITSILMMVMAIALFVTAGFNEVSYAVDSTGNTTADKLYNATTITASGVPYHINAADWDATNQQLVGRYTVPVNMVVVNDDTAHPLQVPCLDRNKDLTTGVTYTPDPDNASYTNTAVGLSVLLEGFEETGWDEDSIVGAITIRRADNGTVTAQDKQMVKTFLLQTAIWVYQDRLATTSPFSVKLTGDRRTELLDSEGKVKKIDAIQYKPTDGTAMTDPTQTVTLTVSAAEDGEELGVADIIEEFVEVAQFADSLFSAFPNNTIGLSVGGEQKVEGDYFISGALSVNYSGSLDYYTVKIVSGPEGAKLVDEDGEEIEEGNRPSGKMYVMVPKKSISKDKNEAVVKITGKFDNYSVNRYIPNNSAESQNIGVYFSRPSESEGSLGVKFKEEVDVPNTGMTTAQTIYFVGLVVLLCGVGIVYANVKPKEAE